MKMSENAEPSVILGHRKVSRKEIVESLNEAWRDKHSAEAALASERAAHAETKRERDEVMEALPFVVQYRRTDSGVRWVDMAAFDVEGPAERYCQACAETTLHWEYRVARRVREGGKAE